jgi:hypothetical protein
MAAEGNVGLKDISIQSRGNRLVLEFPKQALSESNQVLLSTDIFIGAVQVDRTAWQTIEIR